MQDKERRIFTLRLSNDDYEKIKIIAECDHRSMSNHIQTVLKRSIAQYESEHGPLKVERS